MDIENELKLISEAKIGSKEMALFFDINYSPSWLMYVGNPCHSIMLGESDGELIFEGESLKSVIQQAKIHFQT